MAFSECLKWTLNSRLPCCLYLKIETGHRARWRKKLARLGDEYILTGESPWYAYMRSFDVVILIETKVALMLYQSLVVEGQFECSLAWKCHFSWKTALFFGGHQRCIQITGGNARFTLEVKNIELDSGVALHRKFNSCHIFLAIREFQTDLLGRVKGFWGVLKTQPRALTSQTTERPPGHVYYHGGERAFSFFLCLAHKNCWTMETLLTPRLPPLFDLMPLVITCLFHDFMYVL